MTAPDERRELWLAVVVCAAGAGLVLWGSSGTWSTLTPVGHQPGVVAVPSSGRTLYPAVAALGWLALAGSLALVALRGPLRRGLGVLLVLAGGVVALDVVIALGNTEQLPDAGAESFALRTGTGWILLALLGAVLVALAGGFTAWRGGDWVGLGSSYDAPGAAPEPPVTDKAVWDALDRGDDPTA
jgi:hypothetical protein